MALTDILGIGPATADKLAAAGIRTESQLAAAKVSDVAFAAGRSANTAEGWIQAARDAQDVETFALSTPDESPPANEPGTRRPKGDGMRLAGDIFLGLDLAYLGLIVLGSIVALLVIVATGDDSTGGTAAPEGIDEEAWTRFLLWGTNIHNLIVFGAVPLAWVAMTHFGGWAGIQRVLGLHGGWKQIGLGSLVGVGMVVVFGGIGILIDQLGLGPEDSAIEDLVVHITWPLVIVTSLVAGFAEEIMFRGVLQKWLRWWGQGLVFGLLHLGNAGLFSFAITAVIGLGFGYARHRGVSLWTLIAAHVVYDLILLSTVMIAPELGADDGSAWLR